MDDKMREEVTRLHAQVCSGLADTNRILMIYCLAEGPCSVNELAKKLDLSQPTASRHLKILRDRGIVSAERDGQNVIYKLVDARFIQALDLLRACLADSLTTQAALMQSAAAEAIIKII
jgi:DNA-binding transcriptional ArsR family regulator